MFSNVQNFVTKQTVLKLLRQYASAVKFCAEDVAKGSKVTGAHRNEAINKALEHAVEAPGSSSAYRHTPQVVKTTAKTSSKKVVSNVLRKKFKF